MKILIILSVLAVASRMAGGNPTGISAVLGLASAVPGGAAVPGIPAGNPLDLAAQIAAHKDSLFKSVSACKYDDASSLLKIIVGLDTGGSFLTDIFNKLFATKLDILTFALSLWTGGSQDIVAKHFPPSVHSVCKGDSLFINNVGYNQYLSCNSGDKKVRAVADKNADTASFKLIPDGNFNNAAVFKLRNAKLNLYIGLDATADNTGDHQLILTEDANDESTKFIMEPWKIDATNQEYMLTSVKYSHSVKLGRSSNSDGSRYCYTNGREDPNNSKEDATFHFKIHSV